MKKAATIKDIFTDPSLAIGQCRNSMSRLIRKTLATLRISLPKYDKMLNNYTDKVMRDMGTTSITARSQHKSNFNKAICSPTTTDKNFERFVDMLAVYPEFEIDSVDLTLTITKRDGTKTKVTVDLYKDYSGENK